MMKKFAFFILSFTFPFLTMADSCESILSALQNSPSASERLRLELEYSQCISNNQTIFYADSAYKYKFQDYGFDSSRNPFSLTSLSNIIQGRPFLPSSVEAYVAQVSDINKYLDLFQNTAQASIKEQTTINNSLEKEVFQLQSELEKFVDTENGIFSERRKQMHTDIERATLNEIAMRDLEKTANEFGQNLLHDQTPVFSTSEEMASFFHGLNANKSFHELQTELRIQAGETLSILDFGFEQQNFGSNQMDIFRNTLSNPFFSNQDYLESFKNNDHMRLLNYATFELSNRGFQAMDHGSKETAWGYFRLATDLGTAIAPGVNDVRDWFELVSGIDMITQEELSFAERSFCLIGLFVGSGAGFRIASDYTSKLAKRGFGKLEEVLALGEELHSKGLKWDRVSTDVINETLIRNGFEPAWRAGKNAIETTLKNDITVWRVHDESMRAVKEWVLHVNPRTLSKKELKETFSIPNNANFITEIKIPAGTKVRGGIAGPNKWGKGGGFQWEILDRVQPEWKVSTELWN
ncbi:MAG: hypothetical protein HYS98_09015 [Deltaproteobacteria bacterium]|nr:hypothetical protein [Deltaproteobacteria bacterium]